MKVKINLDTQSAAARLVDLAMYAAFDFSEIWPETENNNYFVFQDFIAE